MKIKSNVIQHIKWYFICSWSSRHIGWFEIFTWDKNPKNLNQRIKQSSFSTWGEMPKLFIMRGGITIWLRTDSGLWKSILDQKLNPVQPWLDKQGTNVCVNFFICKLEAWCTKFVHWGGGISQPSLHSLQSGIPQKISDCLWDWA